MSIFDAIGSFLGFNDNGQGAAQDKANQQYGLQQQYGAAGANIYAGLNNQGSQQYGTYSNNYIGLLNDYAGLSGLGGNLINPAQGLTQQQIQTAVGPTAPGQAAAQPGQAQGQNAGNFNGNTGQWINAGGSRTSALTPGGVLSGHGVTGQPTAQPNADPNGQAQNPYQLDQYQQQQLNQSNALIAQSAKQAQGQFVQHMTAQGITDPRALQVGQEQLQEHFSALQAETQTKFYEQVKQDKLTALQQILSGISQYGQQGIGEQEAAGTGYLGLAQGAQAAQNQQNSLAQQALQETNSQTSGVLDLIGFGLGGGFGGAGGGGAGATAANIGSGAVAGAAGAV